MRKIISAFIVTVFVVLIGCSAEGSKKSLTLWYKDTREQKYYSDIIYEYRNQNPDIPVAIDIFENLSDEQYAAKCQTAFMSSNGPDMVFLNGDIPLFTDINKVMRAGTFADLIPLLEEDPTFKVDDYFTDVLKCGQNDGKQFIFPISFSIDTIFAYEDTTEKYGVNLDNCKTLDGMTAELIKCISENADITPFDYTHGIAPLCENLLDYQSSQVNIDTAVMRSRLEQHNLLFDRVEGQRDVITKSANPLQDKLIFSVEGGGVPDLILAANLNLVGTPVLHPFYTDKGNISGVLNEGVAIMQTSKNKDAAVALLRLAISKQVQSDRLMPTHSGISSLKSLAFEQVDAQEQIILETYNKEDSDFHVTYVGYEELKPLSDEFYANYKALLEQPMSIRFNTEVFDKIERGFAGYYSGKTTVDECLKQLQQTYEIYISE